jgi:transposase
LSEGIPGAHPRIIPPLILSAEDRAALDRLARSRAAPVRAVTRARVRTAYADDASCPTIARTLGIPLSTVMSAVKRALALGPRRALEDWPRAGRPSRITSEAGAWIISLACQKPEDLGWAPACWREALRACSVRAQAVAAGHPSARQVVQAPSPSGSRLRTGTPIGCRTTCNGKIPKDGASPASYQPVTLDLDPADGRPTVRWFSEEKSASQRWRRSLPIARPGRTPPGGAPGNEMTHIAASGRSAS